MMKIVHKKRLVLAILALASGQAGSADYVFTDLGTLGGSNGSAKAINNNGQVVGWSLISGDATTHAFLFSNGQMTDIGQALTGNQLSVATAINDKAQVVGYASPYSGGLAPPYNTNAFVYSLGGNSYLGSLGGSGWGGSSGSDAGAINNQGQVVGSALTAGDQVHAYLYSNGTMTDLGALSGNSSYAVGINDQGQVVGNAYIGNGQYHPFLYSNGVMTDLSPLLGQSHVSAINNKGQMIGDGSQGGFLYSNGIMTIIGGGASAINNQGQVVGGSIFSVWLYSNGVMFELNNLIDPSTAAIWSLSSARGINDLGQIVGDAFRTNSYHPYLLTPTYLTIMDTVHGDVAPSVFSSNSIAYWVPPTLTFNGGTLQYAASLTTTKNAVINSSGGTIDSNGYTPTLMGTISGVGGLTVTGSGMVTLAGNNTYTGGTTINPGASLQLGNGGTSGSIMGNVTDNGSLIFNRSDAVTIGASIVGAGTLTQAGSGLLNLTGTTTLGGGTFVQQGLLAVNGTLNSSLNVAAAGTLKGTGQINGPVTVYGTLAPGNSPGTLTANGTVTLNAGSVFKAQIDGTGTGNEPGNYTRLVVNGAGNQFVNNGATLDLASSYTPTQGDKFNLVSAQGRMTGRFSSVNLPGLSNGLRFKTFYNANGLDVFATPASYLNTLYRSGANDNAQSVGKVLNQLTAISDAGYSTQRQEQLLYSVAGLNSVQLPRVATALAGEVHGAMAAASPDAGRWLQSALARQLVASAREGEQAGVKPGDNLWFDFNASQGHTDGGGYASSYGYSRYQFAIGGDILHSQANRFGVGVTYATTSVSPNSGSGTLEETAPFVYGQYAFGKSRQVIVDGLFAYGFNTWKTERANPLYATGPLKTNASGSSTAWGVGLRSPFEFDGYTVEPFTRVLWQNSSRGGVSEGFSPAALNLTQYSLNGTRLLVGAALGSQKHDPLAATLTYRVSVAFGNDFGNLVYPTVTASLAGDSFQINSPHVGRQFAQLNLSGTYQLVDNTYAYVGLIGEARENRLDGSVNAGLNMKF